MCIASCLAAWGTQARKAIGAMKSMKAPTKAMKGPMKSMKKPSAMKATKARKDMKEPSAMKVTQARKAMKKPSASSDNTAAIKPMYMKCSQCGWAQPVLNAHVGSGLVFYEYYCLECGGQVFDIEEHAIDNCV